MCGIAGTAGRADRDLVTRMIDIISHRGPDDSGVYLSDAVAGPRAVGLGNRRLSIIDLSPAGRMPMSNHDGTIWLSYNGEVYNHPELRRELEAAGHRFRSRTDTEVILQLYEAEGLAMLPRLDGMFAFALWDERRGQLVLARDRLGV